jgi:hypothetical protein
MTIAIGVFYIYTWDCVTNGYVWLRFRGVSDILEALWNY